MPLSIGCSSFPKLKKPKIPAFLLKAYAKKVKKNSVGNLIKSPNYRSTWHPSKNKVFFVENLTFDFNFIFIVLRHKTKRKTPR